MSFVSHQSPNGLEYFIKADQAEGLTVIVAGDSVVKLDAAAAKKFVNFFRQYTFLSALSAYRRAANGAGKKVHTFIENNTTKTISVMDLLILDETGKSVTMDAKVVRMTDGQIQSSLTVDANTLQVIMYELAKADIKADVKPYRDVVSVSELPSETAFKKATFYKVKADKKVYKLNAAEDGFEEVTEKIVDVPRLPAVKSEAKEGVIYFLNQPTGDADRGFFEYKAAKKDYIKADYVGLKEIARLPKDEDIENNMIYVVSKEIKVKDQDPIKAGTVYVGKEQALEKKELTIQEVTELPNLVVAEEGVIYNVNGVYRKFTAGEFGDIIAKDTVKLDEKPDFAKVGLTVDDSVIYVLNKQVSAEKPVGSKWVFDSKTKEFVKYNPEAKVEA